MAIWNGGMKDDFLSLKNQYPDYALWVSNKIKENDLRIAQDQGFLISTDRPFYVLKFGNFHLKKVNDSAKGTVNIRRKIYTMERRLYGVWIEFLSRSPVTLWEARWPLWPPLTLSL